MKRALAAEPSKPFDVPDGIAIAESTRQPANSPPACPVVIQEAFLSGTEPREFCDVHGAGPV